jgi:hypothetical protein
MDDEPARERILSAAEALFAALAVARDGELAVTYPATDLIVAALASGPRPN